MVLIEEVHWGGRLARLSGEVLAGACLNHFTVVLNRLPLLGGESADCIACATGQPACFLLRDGDWHGTLCRGHAMAYLSRTLAPLAFRRIVADAGGDPEAVFALHRDFYDPENGTACHPFPIGTEALADYISDLEELPKFDPADDMVGPELARMFILAKDGYRASTGLDLDDGAAWYMVAAALMNEEFRRGGGTLPEPRPDDY